MSVGTILLIILVLLLIGALPNWGYSRDWGQADNDSSQGLKSNQWRSKYAPSR
jgi:hypothetical protein